LHVKGLTCFVATAGGRASPALTLHEGGMVELVSPRGDRLARALISFAVPGPGKSVVTLADHTLVIAGAATAERPVVVVDFGPGSLCFIGQAAEPAELRRVAG
jgi:hypothetical protein